VHDTCQYTRTHFIWAARVTLPDDQKGQTSCHPTRWMVTHPRGRHVWGVSQWLDFFPPSLLLPLLDNRVGLENIKSCPHIFFYFNCSPHSFDCFLFVLNFFYFFISSLSIWFYLIFISNLIFILLIAIFLYSFLD